MQLGAYTVANPTEMEKTTYTAHRMHTTYGGKRAQSYFSTGYSNPIKGFRIRITWTNLSATEMAQIALAHKAALQDYVVVQFDGLGGEGDQATMTVDYENPGLIKKYQQGYAGNPLEGPIYYEAEGFYIAYPENVEEWVFPT